MLNGNEPKIVSGPEVLSKVLHRSIALVLTLSQQCADPTYPSMPAK